MATTLTEETKKKLLADGQSTLVPKSPSGALTGTLGGATATDEGAHVNTAGAKENWLDVYDTLQNQYKPDGGKKTSAEMLAQYEASAPSQYQSPYAGRINDLLAQIANRPNFSYDAGGDPIYQQYAEQYQRGGQRAMQDTMGNSAALTGGYGNSYAATAGNQSYQNYLAGMNDVLPELRDAAYQMYQGEGTQLQNNLAAFQGQEKNEFARYQQALDEYNRQKSYWQQKALADAAASAPSGGPGGNSGGDNGNPTMQQLLATGSTATTIGINDAVKNALRKYATTTGSKPTEEVKKKHNYTMD